MIRVSGPETAGGWQAWLAQSLTRSDSVEPADLLFVMAGRMERKPYGLELYRAGVAPRLVLSVGRFEVSRMAQLDLEGMHQLVALRDQTPADERHFFVSLDRAGLHLDKVRAPRWSTYGEALALRQFLQPQAPRKVIVISSGVHLRRVALTFAHVFRDAPIQFRYCPVPARCERVKNTRWFLTHRDDEADRLRRYLVDTGMGRPPAYAIEKLAFGSLDCPVIYDTTSRNLSA
jgi:uncharacterized SAM-binding protein YcdF (DUF218 family)